MQAIKANAFARSPWPVFVNFFTCDVPGVLEELEESFPEPEVRYKYH